MGSGLSLRWRNRYFSRTDQLIMNIFIDWHKKFLEWFKKKLNISNYGIAWIAFIKGLVIGLLIYHFFIET